MTVAWSRFGLILAWRGDVSGYPRWALYLGTLLVGGVVQGGTERHKDMFRAWIMTMEEGDFVGWYPTEQTAKEALVEAVVKGMFDNG